MPNRAPLQPPILVVPREEARARITANMSRGATLLDAPILSFGDLMKLRVESREWSNRNHETLSHLFDSSSVADAYGKATLDTISGPPDMMGKIREFHQDVRRSMDKLQAIHDVLDRIPTEPPVE